MITYLPDFLPDELFYSYVARYHHESGNISLRQTQSQVYSKIRNYFDISFIGDINDNFYNCVLSNTPSVVGSVTTLILSTL